MNDDDRDWIKKHHPEMLDERRLAEMLERMDKLNPLVRQEFEKTLRALQEFRDLDESTPDD